KSPLLDSLFRKGIDFRKIRKFSTDEIEFSKRVGDRYLEFSGGLRAIRRARTGEGDNEQSCLISGGREDKVFLDFLEANKVAKLTKTLFRPDGNWRLFKKEWFGDRNARAEVLAVLTLPEKPVLFRLLQGEWLNAYVYSIIRDHLE